MKRFLALLALVMVLMFGTAGMVSATTLAFEFGDPTVSSTQLPETPYIPPAGSPIASVTYVNWHNDGGGHLYCNNSMLQNIISFTTPTYVNSFQMTGLLWATVDSSSFSYGPMDIKAFKADGAVAWSTTVDFAQENPNDPGYPYYVDWANWLTVVVNTADVSKIVFYGPNPTGSDDGLNFYPSIDNLVINEAAAVPIPASVWLLGSGLLGLVGLRRKFTC
jgi:hypothetical protein